MSAWQSYKLKSQNVLREVLGVEATEELPDDAAECLLELLVCHHVDYGVESGVEIALKIQNSEDTIHDTIYKIQFIGSSI